MQRSASEWPALQGPSSDRLTLRDGSVALVRATCPADRGILQRFFHTLTPESRHKRFFTASEPPEDLVERFCDSVDPARQLTLVALRQRASELQAIAVASYAATGVTAAEAAFAVADDLHGKGLGTALLERLATIAYAHGLECFEATTLAENREMLQVFRDSGFAMRSKTCQGVIDARLDLRPSAGGIATIDERNRSATVESLRSIFRLRAIVVIGVSRDPSHFGRRIYDGLLRDGFKGPIYAVNPRAEEVAGRPSYGSIRDVRAASTWPSSRRHGSRCDVWWMNAQQRG